MKLICDGLDLSDGVLKVSKALSVKSANPVLEGIKLMVPDFDLIRERMLFVLVATKKYENEICKDLETHGFVEGKDYGRMSVLTDKMTRIYLRTFLHQEV